MDDLVQKLFPFHFSAKAIKETLKNVCLSHLRYSSKYLVVIVAFNSISFCKPVPLTPVRTMDIYDEQTTTMRVRWEEAEGATGYMLLYSAVNASRPTREQEVRDILSTENTVRLNKEGNQPTSCGYDRFGRRETGDVHMFMGVHGWTYLYACKYRQTNC